MRTHPAIGLVTADLLLLARFLFFFFSATVYNYHACFSFLPGIPKVLLLLTDGESNGTPPGKPANELRNLGVRIFSIGLGLSDKFQKELKQIASDPDTDHVFTLNSFNQLPCFCNGK